MKEFDIDRRAPASGRAFIDIHAPSETVWRHLASIPEWPIWNQAVSRTDATGPARFGLSFRWTAGGLPIRSRIARFEPRYVIGWTGEAPLIRARHVYRLSDLGEATRVETEESFDGPLARLLPSLVSRVITRSLEQGLAALKTACEAERARVAAETRRAA